MKRITAFFLVCLFILAGCQPTPAVETVPPKDFDVRIDRAQRDPEPASVTVAPVTETAVGPEAADGGRFLWDFYGNTEAFHVLVDAEVIRPERPFPIVEVSPGDFDDESAQPFFDVLTEGFTLYTEEELETKASLEKQIAELQQFIDDGLPGFDGTNEQTKKEMKSSDMSTSLFQLSINSLE